MSDDDGDDDVITNTGHCMSHLSANGCVTDRKKTDDRRQHLRRSRWVKAPTKVRDVMLCCLVNIYFLLLQSQLRPSSVSTLVAGVAVLMDFRATQLVSTHLSATVSAIICTSFFLLVVAAQSFASVLSVFSD